MSFAKFALLFLVAASLALPGCSGDDGSRGKDGAPGAPGDDGAPGAPGEDGLDATEVFSLKAESPETLVFTVTSISIASPPVINFTVKGIGDRGAVYLGSYTTNSGTRLGWVRFSMAKLVPGTNGDPDTWADYISGERVPAGLVDHHDGSYTYTFAKDLGAYSPSIPYDAALTHRLAIQSSGGTWAPVNLVVDFVPNQLPSLSPTFPNTHDIVTTAACNECHGELVFHGSRYETKYCVVCHNPTLGEWDMPLMVHAIHAGAYREEIGAPEYEMGAEITYPQDLRNCLKCHKGTDGNNYKTRPSMIACGSCHGNIDWATGANHDGGPATSNTSCATCHSDVAIDEYHLTDNATPNNPNVPLGAVNFTYEIKEVTVDGNLSPVVTFRILADGTPVTFNAAGSPAMLTNFTGSPSFLMAYALPQDGETEPTDYNNIGKAAAQPASVSIANCWNSTQGALTGPDASGYYVATINGSSNAGRFPQGATMRAVALQGYFTQVSPAVARHTISVVKEVTGDAVRRTVVDSAKCADCHEWFEGHGGNRVYNIQVCTVCHVPNLSTSGRGANLSLSSSNSATQATIAALGSDPLTYPEDTNNLKDMIHGIHAAAVRETDYEFVRDRGTSGVYYYNWNEVTFPGILTNCTTCHLPGTFELDAIPADGLLATNTFTTTGNPEETSTDVVNVRKTVPNSTDVVNSPIASTCYYCHDSEAAVAHMEYNGGAIRWVRSIWTADMPFESCIVCHGPHKIADLATLHEEYEGDE